MRINDDPIPLNLSDEEDGDAPKYVKAWKPNLINQNSIYNYKNNLLSREGDALN